MYIYIYISGSPLASRRSSAAVLHPRLVVGVLHVVVDIPGLRLLQDGRGDHEGAELPARDEVRHEVVDGLVDGKRRQQPAGAPRPQHVADRRPDVLGLAHQLAHPPAPGRGLGVAQVEEVWVLPPQLAQRGAQPLQVARLRQGVVLEDEGGPRGLGGAAPPQGHVRRGAAALATREGELAGLVAALLAPFEAPRDVPPVPGRRPREGDGVGGYLGTFFVLSAQVWVFITGGCSGTGCSGLG